MQSKNAIKIFKYKKNLRKYFFKLFCIIHIIMYTNIHIMYMTNTSYVKSNLPVQFLDNVQPNFLINVFNI